jgi:hypothetical protein
MNVDRQLHDVLKCVAKQAAILAGVLLEPSDTEDP